MGKLGEKRQEIVDTLVTCGMNPKKAKEEVMSVPREITKEERKGTRDRVREYRKRVAHIKSDAEVDELLAQYEADGLTRNDYFRDFVFKKAVQENNARYADIWQRISKIDTSDDGHVITGDELVRIEREAERGLGEFRESLNRTEEV